MERVEMAKLLRIARTVWPDIAVDTDTVTAWSWALESFPYGAVESALKDWIRASPFAPKPADLSKIISEASAAGEPWETAWDELMATIRRYGIYYADDRFRKDDWPGWSSHDVEAAVRHIGYREVCGADTDQLGTVRAQFRDAYVNAQKRRVRDVQTGAKDLIAALAERSNRSLDTGQVRRGEPVAIADLVKRSEVG